MPCSVCPGQAAGRHGAQTPRPRPVAGLRWSGAPEEGGRGSPHPRGQVPGQGEGGHFCTSTGRPPHGTFLAFLQLRRRTRVPALPQLREQGLQDPHSIHADSAGGRRRADIGHHSSPPSSTPPNPPQAPQPGVTLHHGDTGCPPPNPRMLHPTARARPAPAHPTQPCQAIFTSVASVIAIKLRLCSSGGRERRRRWLGEGGDWGGRGVPGSLPGQGPALHGRRSTALPLHLSSLRAATSRALTQRRVRVWVPLVPQALREQGLQEDQCDQ